MQYNLGQETNGSLIPFPTGSFNIGAVFDPGIVFTPAAGFPDTSDAVAANGDVLGLATLSINGTQFTAIQTQAIPEPGALPVLLIGVVTLVTGRRRN